MPTDKDFDAAEARIGGIAPAKGAEGRFNAISDKATTAYAKAQQGGAYVDRLKRYKDSNPALVATAMDGLNKMGASDVVAKGKAIEQQLSKFAEKSQFVMKGLDLVAGVHPFIGAAVSVLKTAIQFEITRRNNDKKVLALKDKMMDMMDVLRSLKDVEDPSRVDANGTSLKGRMQRTLEGAMHDIHECSATCEEYLHKKFVVRLLDGSRWEGRLASYGDVFDKRREEFVLALNMHTALGVDNLQATMGASQNQLSMLLLFVQLQTLEERELLNLIDERGGPEVCLSNEQVFAELQAKMKVSKGARDSAAQEDVRIAIGQIREDMKEDIDVALAKERKAFDRKFYAIQETLEEMKNVVTRNSDRNTDIILANMKAGPHERILDKDLHAVWEFMSWRGSVKARQFIVSIQDHFLQKYGGGGEAIPTREENAAAPSDPASGADDPAQDKWAIKYITLTRVRPILEAFDDDASGWISIKEANTFTSTRPHDYSVLKWLAFWAAGFRVVCKDYALKIDALRVQMIKSATHALPCNRLLVDKYLSKWYMDIIDYLTRGVLTKDKYDGNEDDDDIWAHFHDFVTSEEARLQRNLDRFGVIDDSNTLSLILGPGRLERNIFPLLFLVLLRHYNLLRLAARFRIDDQDFDEAEASLANIVDALDDRLHTLVSNFRNQNLDPKQQLDTNLHKYSVYYDWTLNENVNAHEYRNIAHIDMRGHAPTTSILRYEYGLPSVPLHFYESFIAENAGPSPSSEVSGLWVGRHYYGHMSRDLHDGMLAIRIDVSDGKVTGEGKDYLGKFTLLGTANLVDPSGDPTVRLHIEFDTTAVYLSEFCSRSPVYRYIGDVQTEDGLFTKISGKWLLKSGYSDTFDEKGDFMLDRSLAIVARHRPPGVMDAKARWDMLAKVVLEQVRRRQGKWKYYSMRRKDRIRVVEANQRCFVSAEPQWYLRTYPPENTTWWFAEQQKIESRLVVEDIAFYRWLAQQRLRSETVHLGIGCDGCRGSPIGPRFICLDCKPADPNRGIDLCSKCRDATLSFPAPRSLEHVPSHDMLKTLRVLTRRELVRTLNFGRWRLAIARQRLELEKEYSIESESRSRCLNHRVCGSTVAKPCWSCIECPGDAFLCDSCEFRQLAMSVENPERDWKDAPTLDRENEEDLQPEGGDGFEASDNSSSSDSESEGESSTHFWWHVLVRVKDSPTPIAPSKLELDARLSILEQKFTAAQSSLALLEKKSDAAQRKLDDLVDLVVALDDKVDTGLDGRLEKLENASRVQQGLFDAQIAGVETLLRQVLGKLG
ncbi:hypothetical protein EXIGLDRAFT_833894 [Exidia glandulosa HHB12029]|uniref:EF-hand domain-containing protein n=1 Tax=Exidia glandulosa HHB12029 TaxID=1314781 RepID=A0A165KC97_EXIGL|nr:hypothetical protein EXIGLDRAFT_833894 [Exidia glandulosa HHB12029]